MNGLFSFGTERALLYKGRLVYLTYSSFGSLSKFNKLILDHLEIVKTVYNKTPFESRPGLLEKDLDLFGERPLERACRFGNFSVVRFLVEKGADISHDSFYTVRIPLSLGNLEIAKFLIAKEAKGDMEVEARILRAEENMSIHLSALTRQLGSVKYLLEKGIDPLAYPKSRTIAVIGRATFSAVKNQDLKMLRLFAAYGVELSDPDLAKMPTSPSSFEIFRFLLSQGIKSSFPSILQAGFLKMLAAYGFELESYTPAMWLVENLTERQIKDFLSSHAGIGTEEETISYLKLPLKARGSEAFGRKFLRTVCTKALVKGI